MLDLYERKGIWDVVAEREPVTQLQRARVENELDAYRERIVALYADAGGVPPQLPEATTPATSGPQHAGEGAAPDAAPEPPAAVTPPPAQGSASH